MMSTPVSTQTSPNALISAGEYTVPVGLLGLFRINTRVRGVIDCRSWSGVTLNSVRSLVCRITGVAPASFTISG